MLTDAAMATQTKMLTAPFRGKHGATSYRREVGYAAIREVVSGFTTAEGQYLSPKTSKVYKKVAKSRRWQQYDVDLGEGAMGHWIGPKDAKYVMIYFHGRNMPTIERIDDVLTCAATFQAVATFPTLRRVI